MIVEIKEIMVSCIISSPSVKDGGAIRVPLKRFQLSILLRAHAPDKSSEKVGKKKKPKKKERLEEEAEEEGEEAEGGWEKVKGGVPLVKVKTR